MQTRKEFKIGGNPINSILGIVIFVFMMIGLWFIARFFFKLLYWLSPAMLIATLIIDYKVVTGYGQWLVKLTKSNAIMGIGAIVLTVLAFPLVSAFLLSKALFKKKIKSVEKQAQQAREGEFIEYEELDSAPLELPKLQKEKKTKDPSSDYEQLFD